MTFAKNILTTTSSVQLLFIEFQKLVPIFGVFSYLVSGLTNSRSEEEVCSKDETFVLSTFDVFRLALLPSPLLGFCWVMAEESRPALLKVALLGTTEVTLSTQLSSLEDLLTPCLSFKCSTRLLLGSLL